MISRKIIQNYREVEKFDNKIIKIIKVQFRSVQLRLIHVLKQEPFGQ